MYEFSKHINDLDKRMAYVDKISDKFYRDEAIKKLISYIFNFELRRKYIQRIEDEWERSHKMVQLARDFKDLSQRKKYIDNIPKEYSRSSALAQYAKHIPDFLQRKAFIKTIPQEKIRKKALEQIESTIDKFSKLKLQLSEPKGFCELDLNENKCIKTDLKPLNDTRYCIYNNKTNKCKITKHGKEGIKFYEKYPKYKIDKKHERDYWIPPMSPNESAAKYPEKFIKIGKDGNKWIVIGASNEIKHWVKYIGPQQASQPFQKQDLSKLTVSKLKQRLDKIGIQYKKSAKKSDLLALLQQKLTKS
jgi:hypothetical protein